MFKMRVCVVALSNRNNVSYVNFKVSRSHLKK